MFNSSEVFVKNELCDIASIVDYISFVRAMPVTHAVRSVS